MARTTTRKSKATAVIATPKFGDNKPAVMDDRLIRQYVQRAFAEADEGGRLRGSSVQRLAAAIIGQVQVWEFNGHPDENVSRIPPLAQCNTSTDTRNEMLPLLRAQFLNEVSKEGTAEEIANEQLARNAHNTLLGRALKVACIIVSNMMTNASFNVQTGNFSVPKQLLLPPKHEWLGFMGKRTEPVMIDGRAYSAETVSEKTGKTVPVRVAASIETLLRVNAPMTPRKAVVASEAKSSVDFAKVKPENAPVRWLLAGLHKILCETEGSSDSASGAFTSEEWGYFSDLAQWSDEQQSKSGFVKDALDRELTAKKRA